MMLNPLVMEDLRAHYPQYWRKIDRFRLERAEKIIQGLLSEKNKGYGREIDPRIVTTAVLAGIQAVLNPDFVLANNLTLDTVAADLFTFYQNGFNNKGDDL